MFSSCQGYAQILENSRLMQQAGRVKMAKLNLMSDYGIIKKVIAFPLRELSF